MKKIKFSIVIALAPDRNAEVLGSLKKVNFPKNKYEIIIEKGLNPSDNRNKGAKKAKGEIIAFIDDDAQLDRNIFKKAEGFFSKHEEINIVGGPQLTPKDDKGFAKISGYALASRFGAWKMSNRYSCNNIILNADETMLTSANLFCRRNVLKKIKFDPKLFPGEDPDFISRAKEKGFGIAYSPDIVVYHRRRATIKELARQIYTYGKTRPEKEGLKETLKMPFFLIPSIFLIYLFILLLISISNVAMAGNVVGISGSRNFMFFLFVPLITYIILNLAFSLFHAVKNKEIEAFFVLPLIYLLIHLSYGAGFLVSTIKNISKKRKHEKA